MSDTKVRIRKATMTLREDHKTVKKLLSSYARLDSANDPERSHTFEHIRRELGVHFLVEEEIFYPAIGAAEHAGASDLVQKAREEHRIAKTLIEELSKLPPSDAAFEAKMKVLGETVLNHIKEEERDLFPIFSELEKEEQARVSERVDARTRELKPEG